ncbi:DNA-binding response regulator [Candidatus Moduliflexota bacterium]
MPVLEKRILIVDEGSFSRVCSAILEFEGYDADTLATIDNLKARLEGEDFGLVVTSYPYGAFLMPEIREKKIPAIVLCDQINPEIVGVLEGTDNSFCMIKPLDYLKFKALVKRMMSGENTSHGGYKVV